MMGRYTTIAITKDQKIKLDLIKGNLSYSKLLDEGFFKKVDKTNQLLRLIANQDKMIEMLNRLAKEFSSMSKIVKYKAGEEVEAFEFKAEEWCLEEKKITNTIKVEEEPKQEFPKENNPFKRADEI